ncbi:6-phosphofructokinase [Mycoplasmatota bacterium]|nr:6-phosphofructokinase [Mycoplasmatota bacterium]
MKKIGILTSGGDAPGMNAAVRSVTRAAIESGHEVYGIYYGYKGLIDENIEKFDRFTVSEKLNRGGTFLRSARFPEFKNEEVRIEAVKILKKYGIEYLVVIGGDGSFMGAKKLNDLGVKCIGIPGTIDNDLNYTDFTLGFDTALNTIVEAIDKLRDTSASHQRCNIVEVMGRNCGDLSIHAAISVGAKHLITPETGFDKDDFLNELIERNKEGIKYSIVVITENIVDVTLLAKEIEEKTKIETRATILGHVQRGGAPTASDRMLGMRFGVRTVELINANIGGRCVGIDGDEIIDMDITDALEFSNRSKTDLIRIFEMTK